MLTKAAKTKQHIIEMAAPIFNTKGYAATSMADILQATGLAKGGIYGSFAGKDEIAVHAFEYAFESLVNALRSKIKQQPTATGKLLAILKFYHNYTIKPHIEGGCPLLNTSVDADDNIPFLKQRAAAALQLMLGSLRNIIKKGVENGEFKKTLDVKKEAAFFFAVIEGGIMMAKVSDQPARLNSLLTGLKQHVVNNLKK
jgi:TetR/AcrR family transcriptional regulator, transcriptional repressor for nem operon